jgi:Mor family transcriptional regulator
MSAARRYECDDPPCLHVVFDVRRKRYGVFIEDSEGDILYVPASKVEKAADRLSELKSKHFKEAEGTEIDELARKYLGAELVVEENYDE